jgi:hypothetical protein
MPSVYLVAQSSNRGVIILGVHADITDAEAQAQSHSRSFVEEVALFCEGEIPLEVFVVYDELSTLPVFVAVYGQLHGAEEDFGGSHYIIESCEYFA